LGETISRDTVAALQKLPDALTKESRKPLFRIDPFRIVTENIRRADPADGRRVCRSRGALRNLRPNPQTISSGFGLRPKGVPGTPRADAT
jgi:hypothetical protein